MTSIQHVPDGTAGVSILGCGRMGVAIGNALLAVDIPVTVWNRTAEKADGLVARGAVRAETVADAVAANPISIVTLFDYAAVHQVVEAADELLSGRALVNLTTGTPQEAREMSAWVTEHGADYLDGAMMAVPESVATPEAFFFYSGSKDVFTANEAMLSAVATSHYVGADASIASYYDTGLLSTMYGALAGFLHAAAMLDTVDIKPTQFAPNAVKVIEGMIPFISELAKEIESADYSGGASSVDINQSAVDNIVTISDAQGISADVHTPLKALLDQRVADGGGADSFSSLFELIRRRST